MKLQGPLLIDSHVHMCDTWNTAEVLDCALCNVRAGAAELGLEPGGTGVLLFTEAEGRDAFADLARSVGSRTGAGWSFRETEEPISLIALRDGAPKLVLVSGRQIATAERLEVLALGIRERIPSGLGLRDTLARVRHHGGIAVVPWGFGKWWFRRGTRMSELVASSAGNGLFLGDNGGRPRAAQRPRLFERAEALEIPVLAGSDPLPYPHHLRRVGSYGFALEADLGERTPGEDLKRLLRALDSTPPTYGELRSLPQFLRDQSLMRLRPRARSS